MAVCVWDSAFPMMIAIGRNFAKQHMPMHLRLYVSLFWKNEVGDGLWKWKWKWIFLVADFIIEGVILRCQWWDFTCMYSWWWEGYICLWYKPLYFCFPLCEMFCIFNCETYLLWENPQWSQNNAHTEDKLCVFGFHWNNLDHISVVHVLKMSTVVIELIDCLHCTHGELWKN